MVGGEVLLFKVQSSFIGSGYTNVLLVLMM